MKQKIIQLMLLASIYTSAIAQDCPPQNMGKTNAEYKALIQDYCEDGNGISTDPNNLQNPACPDLKNDFEWRIKQDPSVVSVNPEFYIVYDEFGAPKSIRNPFNDPGNHEYSHLDDNHNSNYQPEDGWELLKVDFGALSNFNTGWTQLEQDRPGLNSQLGGAKLPYMILYNKYSGTFRFFGSLLGQMEGYETVRIELRIPERSPNYPGQNTYQDLKATNLLSIQGDAVQPLDQETNENVMVVFAKATNTESQFFWFDIPVAYDPCLCNIRSQLDITFTFVETANISLNGSINGALKTESKPDGTPKAVKVATTVIAAGVSTALAVKTGGAVINFQAYSDLVKLFKYIPGLSSTQQDNLDKLSDYVDCGLKFAKVIKSDYKDVTASGTLTAAQQKAQYKAANNILDANTTFMSSLATGCAKKDNGATTINATANLSGTWTDKIIPGHTEILMAMPGSNWMDFEMDREPYTLNGKTVPSYPVYNERLGTFALLETPKIKLSHMPETSIPNQSIPIIMGSGIEVNRGEMINDFEYTFNPVMNVNMDKTTILCRIVSKPAAGFTLANSTSFSFGTIVPNIDEDPNDPNDNLCGIISKQLAYPTKNYTEMDGMLYPHSSPFVPISQFKDMPIIYSINSGGASNGFEAYYDDIEQRTFIQFKIVVHSNNTNSEEAISTLFYTYPVEIIDDDLSEPHLDPIADVLTCTEYQSYIDNTFIPLATNRFSSSLPDVFFGNKNYNQDVTFSSNDIFAYDGIVYISAKIETSNGKKVTIYATEGFEILPGGEVGSNIELVIGLPFEITPTPPQTFEQVSNFCSNTNKYKAQEFAAAAIQQEKQEYERRAEAANKLVMQKNAQKLNLSLYPNPTNGVYTVRFDFAIQNLEITVLDVNGKEVSKSHYNGEHLQVSLDATQLEAGVYFIDVRDANGKIGRQRLVKY